MQNNSEKIERMAKMLHKALKENAIDERMIIYEIINSTVTERLMIKTAYQELYGINLNEKLSEEIDGYFLETVLALFRDPYEYEAEWIKNTSEGIDECDDDYLADEKISIELFCCRETSEIKNLNAAFLKLYGKNLDSILKKDMNCNLGEILRSIAAGERVENYDYDIESVKQNAQKLHDLSKAKIDVEHSEFIRILCVKSFAELKALFAEYRDKFGQDISHVMRKELSGNLLLACNTIYSSATNKPKYFAKLLRETMSGFGTKNRKLIYILVSRSYIDLNEIKEAYQSFYEKSLASDIKSKTSGDYRSLLLALLGEKEI